MKRAARKAPRARDAAPVFAALGDPTRLRLVSQLCERGPLSIARLTEGSEVTRQAVTKHVRALEEAGLVRASHVGRDRVWELRAARLEEVKRYLDAISTQWDSALGRLRALVER
jgi:DNA-binding transcriptional ArsR family regulator